MKNTPEDGAGTSTQTRRQPSRPKKRSDAEEVDRVTFDQADLSDHEAMADNKEAPEEKEPGTASKKQAAKDLKLKMPELKGKKGSNSKVHIQAFESWASLRELPRTEWRVCFPQTLRGVAQTWYFNYPLEQLVMYKATSKAFIQRFKDERTDEDLLSQLGKIKQKKANVRQFVEEIKDLARQLSSPPGNKSLRAWFLNGSSLKRLAKAKITNPTKSFKDLFQRAMTMERKGAKKERKESSSKSSDSDSSSISFDDEPVNKKAKICDWESELKQMKKKIQELSGVRTKMPKKGETWCTHCKEGNHSTSECIKCEYCERRGHPWEEYPIRISVLYLVRDIDSVTIIGSGLVTAQSLVSGLLVSNSVSGFLDCYWLVSGFLDCDWLVSSFLDCDWLVSGYWWKMGIGRASRRKEKPVGHKSRTPNDHYRKGRGPNLKIACPIIKGKKHDDLDVHIQAFEQYAELKHIMEEEWGEYFPHTLKEAGRKWYYHYPASKLQAYRKLKKAFILEYTDDRGYEDILCELDRIKQAQCPEPDKPIGPEAKQPELVPVRAITRSSGVVIKELPGDEPTSSKLNPKAKEWEQSRSTWKDKGKAKEFDEWK
ncbi:hypothetical protein L7F22_018294 [Adiantum nelumboides]|nr:hypothetical protein [Adiantum nelumboides]